MTSLPVMRNGSILPHDPPGIRFCPSRYTTFSGVQHILCLVFFSFVYFSSCVHYVASVSGLSIFDCPLVFFIVYLVASFYFIDVITSFRIDLSSVMKKNSNMNWLRSHIEFAK